MLNLLVIELNWLQLQPGLTFAQTSDLPPHLLLSRLDWTLYQSRPRLDKEGQRLNKELVQLELETNWIQQQGDQVLIPCIGSSEVETEMETDNRSRD